MYSRMRTTTARQTNIGHVLGGLFVGLCVIAIMLNAALPYRSRAASEPAVLYPVADTADAYVRGGRYADTNYSPATTLLVSDGNDPRRDYHAFLRFDLRDITSANVGSAILKLYVANLPDGDAPMKIFGISTDTWTEGSITWNTQPAAGDLLASTRATSAGWISIDVTSFVRAQFTGDKQVSMVLLDDTRARRTIEFGSRETANPPVLEVTDGADLTPTAPSSTPTSTPTTAPTNTPTSVPPTASVYWGTYINGVPWDMTKLDAFESMLGKRASIVHFGQPWQQNSQFLAFPTTLMDRVRTRGSIPMINWGSWQLGYGVDQPDYRLSVIASGRYDDYIAAWARSAKVWGKPFFLKFDHEMNGWWQFPWAEQLNGNLPGDYVKAWRHVHDIFTQVGATNATWVWCPNIVSAKATSLASLYPGDAYVDWTCLHGYNFGGTDWRTFSEIFRGYAGNPYDSYQQLLDLAPSKPIMLGEWASAEAGDGGAQKAAWIRDALETQIPNNFPQIRAVVWFNWNAEPDRTWVVESSQASVDAFHEAIASPVYASNQFATLGMSPIPPPEK